MAALDQALKLLFSIEAKDLNVSQQLKNISEAFKTAGQDIGRVSKEMTEGSAALAKAFESLNSLSNPYGNIAKAMSGLTNDFASSAKDIAKNRYFESLDKQLSSTAKKIQETKQELKDLTAQLNDPSLSSEDKAKVQDRVVNKSATLDVLNSSQFKAEIASMLGRIPGAIGTELSTAMSIGGFGGLGYKVAGAATRGFGGVMAAAHYAGQAGYVAPAQADRMEANYLSGAYDQMMSGDMTGALMRYAGGGAAQAMNNNGGVALGNLSFGQSMTYATTRIGSFLKNLVTGGGNISAAMTMADAASLSKLEEIDALSNKFKIEGGNKALKQSTDMYAMERWQGPQRVLDSRTAAGYGGVSYEEFGALGNRLAQYGVGTEGISASSFKLSRMYGVSGAYENLMAARTAVMGGGQNFRSSDQTLNYLAMAGISPGQGEVGLAGDYTDRIAKYGANYAGYSASMNVAGEFAGAIRAVDQANIGNPNYNKTISAATAMDAKEQSIAASKQPFNIRRMSQLAALSAMGYSSVGANFILNNREAIKDPDISKALAGTESKLLGQIGGITEAALTETDIKMMKGQGFTSRSDMGKAIAASIADPSKFTDFQAGTVSERSDVVTDEDRKKVEAAGKGTKDIIAEQSGKRDAMSAELFKSGGKSVAQLVAEGFAETIKAIRKESDRPGEDKRRESDRLLTTSFLGTRSSDLVKKSQ